jgi:hypothetical protein
MSEADDKIEKSMRNLMPGARNILSQSTMMLSFLEILHDDTLRGT